MPDTVPLDPPAKPLGWWITSVLGAVVIPVLTYLAANCTFGEPYCTIIKGAIAVLASAGLITHSGVVQLAPPKGQ